MSKRIFLVVAVVAAAFGLVASPAHAADSQWSLPAPMITQRVNATEAVLTDGSVLVAGGVNGSTATANAELFRPGIGLWTPVPAMHQARWLPKAAPLPNNRVLVIGAGDSQFAGHGTYEIYNAAANAWTSAKPVTTSGSLDGDLVALANGKVLYANSAADTALYNPTTDSWQSLPSPWSLTGRVGSVTRLKDGRVLVTTTNGYTSLTSYLFDPVSETWQATAPLPGVADYTQTALLADGRVLAVNDRFNFSTSTYEIAVTTFDPIAQAWTSAPLPSTSLHGARIAATPDGRVLAVGGEKFTPTAGCTENCGGTVTALKNAALFNGATNAWKAEPAMHAARSYPRVVTLASGVLAYGDILQTLPVATSETFTSGPLELLINPRLIIRIALP